MNDPVKFLLDGTYSGVYAAPARVAALRQRAKACGLAWVELDLGGVLDKATFLTCCRAAFGFPSSFGHNWDALADSLQDLSWQPARGYVVYGRSGGEFARCAARDFDTALEILEAASAFWHANKKVFMVLLDAETRGGRALTKFPA